MKHLVFALIIGLSLISCKKEIATETNTTEASPSDTIVNTPENSSPNTNGLTDAMKNMMEKMHKMEKTGNADYDLAASMKEHHQGAIDMSAVETSSGSDAMLKEMAQKMSDMQQKEIDELEEIMSQSKGNGKNYEQNGKGLDKAMMDNMMSMMKMPETTGSIDKDFATMMVKHHKDGIMMGQTILQYAKNAKFKSMTEKMIADQKKDIADLENWLSKHY